MSITAAALPLRMRKPSTETELQRAVQAILATPVTVDGGQKGVQCVNDTSEGYSVAREDLGPNGTRRPFGLCNGQMQTACTEWAWHPRWLVPYNTVA